MRGSARARAGAGLHAGRVRGDEGVEAGRAPAQVGPLLAGPGRSSRAAAAPPPLTHAPHPAPLWPPAVACGGPPGRVIRAMSGSWGVRSVFVARLEKNTNAFERIDLGRRQSNRKKKKKIKDALVRFTGRREEILAC